MNNYSEGKSYHLHLYCLKKDSVCVLFYYDLQTFKYTCNSKYVFLAIKNFYCYLQIILTFHLKLPFKTLFLNFNAMTLLGFNSKALLTHSMPSSYLCASRKIIAFVTNGIIIGTDFQTFINNSQMLLQSCLKSLKSLF